ncbi:AbrB/MazE/SpoVT family DNA-binding domain-containing protein [Brunnivagina elsteri]|uniref:AbrB/MazE/SpoVT family DNA-binding domain-containing protein n=1 Tax=Brunnivagina elsteri CCALA 953 TaxID=987040 RepID=A0A2A2TL88_9CYAN|nr:AbrB/MazE/SpoVT family DNA-binding domain-containing protein [Calothrix elsteri]PAX57935.1 AbrB/MazE/SpoVT family DNA-binding domain-containing protein [Calothrix elsteri CCALA 953]
MFTNIAKWGNSLAIRIPQNLAKEIDLAEGSEVELEIIDGSLVLKLSKRKNYSLDEMVGGITPGNLHGEIHSGAAKGKEIW